MSKNEKCTCKACKNTVFHCQICKFVGFLLPSSSWLLKLPNVKISRRRLADYVKTLHQKACRTCSTIIFLHSTNQIIDFWRCRCRCCRQILNSLMIDLPQLTKADRVSSVRASIPMQWHLDLNKINAFRIKPYLE